MSIIPNNLCIIPARGGSKRMPKKNIQNFLGEPIIAYSIKAAQDSGLFSEIMVSTDDEEIAAVAKKYGATVPFFRSKDNADDFATISDVVDEVLDYYKTNQVNFDNVCCILPTAPLLRAKDLTSSLEAMEKEGFNTIRPIVKFSYPIQRAFRMIGSKVEMLHPEYAKTRSQDLEETYHDAGMFYWMTFNLGLTRENQGGYVISEKYAQDIDTKEDWELAEFKYNSFFREGGTHD